MRHKSKLNCMFPLKVSQRYGTLRRIPLLWVGVPEMTTEHGGIQSWVDIKGKIAAFSIICRERLLVEEQTLKNSRILFVLLRDKIFDFFIVFPYNVQKEKFNKITYTLCILISVFIYEQL